MKKEKLQLHEFYILLLWGNGFSQEAIANKIFRSTKFVENVFRGIKNKCGTKNAQHSLHEAWKQKIFTEDNCVLPTKEQLSECIMHYISNF